MSPHWDELEQAVERLVAADGPNTGDLPADEFFALWARFEADWRLEEQYDFGDMSTGLLPRPSTGL